MGPREVEPTPRSSTSSRGGRPKGDPQPRSTRSTGTIEMVRFGGYVHTPITESGRQIKDDGTAGGAEDEAHVRKSIKDRDFFFGLTINPTLDYMCKERS